MTSTQTIVSVNRGTAFRAMGYPFTLVSDMPDVEEAASRLFRPWIVGSNTSARHVYELRALQDGTGVLYKDGLHVQRGNGPGAMLTWVVADVSAKILANADDVVAVHAGAVSRNGVAVLLPAPPDHGKTTTTIGLIRAGFDLLSDECAAMGLQDGEVHPFPRPLIVSPDSMELFPELRSSLRPWVERFRNPGFLLPAEDVRPGCLGESSRAGFVVAPRYEAEGVTALEPMSRADMLALLLSQTFNLSVVGSAGVERLSEMLREVECYRLRIGDISGAVGLIRSLVEGGS
jgi:hypothetical protein